MNAETAPVPPARPRHGAGKVVAVVLGSLGALIAIALVLAGCGLVLADTTQRDDDGYFTTSTERLASEGYGLTHEGVDLEEVPDEIVDRLGTVRIRATAAGDAPLFVGIAAEADVARYLDGVAHDEVVDLHGGPRDTRVETESRPGGEPAAPPTEEDFWTASSSGTGTQTVTWEVAEGNWAVVVMNADGSRGVAADVQLGADVDWLLGIGIALLVVGLLFAVGSALLIYLGVRATGAGPALAGPPPGELVPAAAATGAPSAAAYPVAVEARLDEPLSRWLWLVKWFLAIPHFVVLAFLWAAFVVLTIVAFFAILFTGRFPRSLFDFNLGVMRWTWRVGFYSVSALGTDRYPPFSLGAEPDYPATLDVPYPERLSRGLVLVKSWLLALPHLLIVALFTGSAAWAWSGWFEEWPGLIGILTFFAGVVLLFRGRYNHDLFGLIVGLNRWVWRVVAYVALMRDEYPPFRLER